MPDSSMRPDPSVAQRLAADPAVSAWVDASAGSGKTKVLTDRVLALLLGGARPHAILCLTFTKAAAGEMANRVADRLALWARADAADLAGNLTDLLGQPPTADQIDRARRLFAKVQEAPGGVRIETVHGFCQGVLQRFPVEANVPPHFDVLEERDQRLLLAQARDELVRAVASAPDGGLAQAWDRMLERLTEQSFAKLSVEMAKQRARLENVQPADVAQVLGIDPQQTPAAILAAACLDDAIDVASLRAAITPLQADSAKTVQKMAMALTDFFGNEPEQRNFDAYATAFLTQAGAPLKLGALKAFKSNDSLLATISAEQDRLIRVNGECAKAVALADTRALLTVTQRLLTRYRALKRSRSLLDYDDLILGAARLLVDPGAAWAHFKLDGGIDHVLVDEAQDTNPAQWQVIAGLIAEFFAGGDERGRTLFAVGDPKQSIYSFQGADPQGFLHRREEFRAAARACGLEWRDVPLTVSFRSAPPVLQLVDAVFEVADRLGVGDAPVQHQPWRATAPGLIEVWPLVAEAEAQGIEDVWQLPRDYEASLGAEDRLAWAVAGKIKDLIESGETLAARDGRAIRAGDIMVLVRRRRRFGQALVSALKRLGVPVAGVDRMALARQLAVQDLVAFGQFLLFPEDDLTLAAVLKGPFFQWSESRLFDLAYGRKGSLWQVLRAAGDTENRVDAQRLEAWLNRADGLAPFALYSRLLIDEGGRTQIRAFLGLEADDPVEEFMALALEFPQHGPPTLQHFLQWLAADDVEIKRELDQGSRDEVRLLTVHAAKGLQAPIVFLPDTMHKPRDSDEALVWAGDVPIWTARKDERDPVSAALVDDRKAQQASEGARLLYVALTRAEDRLYICGWQGKRGAATSDTWYGETVAACERLVASGAMQRQTMEIGGSEGEGYVMGTPPEPASEAEPGPIAIAPLPEWALTPAPPEPSPARPLAPSRPSPLAPALRSPLRNRGNVELRFRRGTLLHRLLQHLPGIAPERRMTVAARVLSDSALPPQTLAAYVDAVTPVLDDPQFAAVFADDALVEAPLTGIIDGIVVSGTVDRLLVTAAKVLIVDYKTNRAPPNDPRAIPLAYLKQMRAYAGLLHGVYPDKTIEAALLWTEVPRLDPVPLAAHTA